MAILQQVQIEYLIEFDVSEQPTTPLQERWWTGNGNLNFAVGGGAAVEWQGTRWGDNTVVDVSGIDSTSEDVSQRISLSMAFSSVNATLRNALNEKDLGPIPVTIYIVWKRAGDAAWNRLPRTIKGRTSRSGMTEGTWSVEVENRNHDRDRKAPDRWADTVQKVIHPGDKGMEFMTALEEGHKFEFTWPN